MYLLNIVLTAAVGTVAESDEHTYSCTSLRHSGLVPAPKTRGANVRVCVKQADFILFSTLIASSTIYSVPKAYGVSTFGTKSVQYSFR